MFRWLLLLLFVLSLGCLAESVNLPSNTPISPPKAQSLATQNLYANFFSYPQELRKAAMGTRAGQPLLVKWLDSHSAYYYIVPFYRNSKASLLVSIDAFTGELQEVTQTRTPAPYPKVNAVTARQLLKKDLQLHKEWQDLQILVQQAPSLVWKLCQQSFDPFDPFWQFQSKSRVRYVGQDGQVYKTLDDPLLKGGGFPSGLQ